MEANELVKYINKKTKNTKKLIDALVDIVEDKEQPPGPRIRAVEVLFKLVGLDDEEKKYDATDVADIATALSVLDKRIKERVDG